MESPHGSVLLLCESAVQATGVDHAAIRLIGTTLYATGRQLCDLLHSDMHDAASCRF